LTKLIAVGNTGRQDDGLGWALARVLEERGILAGNIHYRYQLQVEDAELIARADSVIFVDAFRGELPGGFELRRCEPAAGFAFTTHALPPEAVLFVCEQLYGRRPEARSLLIAGKHWSLGTDLSGAAETNLRRAEEFVRALLVEDRADASS
jgi:hydrogenase maturation protease